MDLLRLCAITALVALSPIGFALGNAPLAVSAVEPVQQCRRIPTGTAIAFPQVGDDVISGSDLGIFTQTIWEGQTRLGYDMVVLPLSVDGRQVLANFIYGGERNFAFLNVFQQNPTFASVPGFLELAYSDNRQWLVVKLTDDQGNLDSAVLSRCFVRL